MGSRCYLARIAKGELVFLFNAPIFFHQPIKCVERLHIGPGQAAARSCSPRWFPRYPGRGGLCFCLDRLLLAPSFDQRELRAGCCPILAPCCNPAAVTTIFAGAVPAGKLHNGVRTPWSLTLHPLQLLFYFFCSVQRSDYQESSAHRAIVTDCPMEISTSLRFQLKKRGLNQKISSRSTQG